MKPSFYPSLSALTLLLGTLSLVGCGGMATMSNPTSTGTPPPAGYVAPQVVAGPAIKGTVFGGHAPLQGAHVYLIQPGITGYGTPAQSILGTGTTTSPDGFTLTANVNDPNVTVGAKFETSDSGGNFNFTGAYSCTVGQPVYIYAWGGKLSAAANNNPNIVQLATLGNCPSSGNFSTPGNGALQFVYLNEVSTIATAYTVQPFTLVGNNNAWDIGIPAPATHPQALTGIANAAATAAQLYDIQGGTQISSTQDGEGHIANFQTQATNGQNLTSGTPNSGNGVVPQATIDTLANIISDCVDTTPTTVGTETTQCSALFKIATNNGEKGVAGNEPTDTATAAINIARFPAGNSSEGTTNVDTTYASDIFALQPGTLPYVPSLNKAPNDWTIAINYPGPNNGVAGSANSSKVTNATLNLAESLAVDSTGQVWITSQGNGTVNNPDIVRWSNLGVQNSITTQPYIPGYVSVDGSGNAWTGNANDAPTALPYAGNGGTGTSIFEDGSNGVFTNANGSGFFKAYVVITDQPGDVFFFAGDTALNGNYDMWEFPPGGGTLDAGSPINISPTTTTTTVPATAPLTILAATANTGGTYTFVISPVSNTFTTPLAVGDTVSLTLTNAPGAGNSPAATGWDKLTSVKVASVNNAASPTSFTATSNTTPTPATTNTVSTNTNGPVETINITSATQTHPGNSNNFTYTFDYTPVTGAPALAVGDTVGLKLADAPAGLFGAPATGWENLTSVTIATVNNGGTSFTAKGTTPVTDSTGLGGGNGATGTGTYNINGATGTGSFTSTTLTTTTAPGAIPAGDNVGHGAMDAAGDLWITAETPGNTIARITTAGATTFTPITLANTGNTNNENQPEFPAIDSSGNAWIALQETASEILKVSPTGATTILTATGGSSTVIADTTSATTATGALMTSTFGAAVDGNGNVWFANRDSNYGISASGVAGTSTIFVLNGGGSTPGTENTAISPATNYVPEAEYAGATTFSPILNGPLNLAIDSSGNVWITNYGENGGGGVVEIVGAAAPVVTPLSVAAGTNSLGQKP
jgi:hypothetical protein